MTAKEAEVKQPGEDIPDIKIKLEEVPRNDHPEVVKTDIKIQVEDEPKIEDPAIDTIDVNDKVEEKSKDDHPGETQHPIENPMEIKLEDNDIFHDAKEELENRETGIIP